MIADFPDCLTSMAPDILEWLPSDNIFVTDFLTVYGIGIRIWWLYGSTLVE